MKKKLVTLLLEEEEEDDELIIRTLSIRRQTNNIFKHRESEGAFGNLINTYLKCDDEKFTEYFRLSKKQFATVLTLVEPVLAVKSTNRYPRPISPSHKLAVTLR